jgi:hypothetical protein
MFPNTRKLVDLMAEEEPESSFPAQGIDEPEMHDPKVLQLRIRRKHQLGMIKKMLEDAGYEDLARMTTLQRREYDDI